STALLRRGRSGTVGWARRFVTSVLPAGSGPGLRRGVSALGRAVPEASGGSVGPQRSCLAGQGGGDPVGGQGRVDRQVGGGEDRGIAGRSRRGDHEVFGRQRDRTRVDDLADTGPEV